MPIVQIEMLEGRTVEQKREMVKKVTEAIVDTVKVTPDKITIIIREMKRENMGKAGKLHLDM